MGKHLKARKSGHGHSCRGKHGAAPDPRGEGRVSGCVAAFDGEGAVLRGCWTVPSTL